jgi:hypothetical protein
MSQVDKKIEFIKTWYIQECAKLSFGDKLKLARIWTEICLSDEEYEMASALQEEKKKVIKRHIKEKRSKRRLSQKFVIWLYLFQRKIKAKLKNRR